MEVFNSLGGEIVLYLQSLGEWLVPIMSFFTFFGDETFYLLILPLAYWSLDSNLGLRIGLILMLSSSLNAILKVAFHSPRPAWINPEVISYRGDAGFGIPSGHAQNAVAVWGVIAAYYKKSWGWAAAVLLIFLIGVSRLVLGEHFPVDVVVGWIIGVLLLYLFLALYQPVAEWYQEKELGVQVVVTLSLVLLLILIGVSVTLLVVQSWAVPPEWVSKSILIIPDEPIDPFALDGLLSTTGALFGLSAGYILLRSQGGYSVRGSLRQHVLRYLIGVAGVLAFWFLLGTIFPDDPDLFSYGLRFLRYSLVGAWIAWWAPSLFIRMNLARRLLSNEKPAE